MILEKAKQLEPQLISMRRDLHRRPELSGQEEETVKYICTKLSEFAIEHTVVPDGGVLGFLGDASRGRTLLLRADIDALPITENPMNLKRAKTVVSEISGVHHACGHDAHTAMLLASAAALKPIEDRIDGRIILFFERGEEAGGNIKYLLEHIDREQINVDAAAAIHVNSGLPSGKLLVQSGPNHAGGFPFGATITGTGGHGSRPDLSASPIDAFVAVYNALTALRLKYTSPFESVTLSIGAVNAGSRSNIIPSSLKFMGTVRFYSEETGRKIVEEIKHILNTVTQTYHCTYELDDMFFGLPVINDTGMSELTAKAVKDRLGADLLLPRQDPSMGSESFSLICKRYPSCMVLLGIQNEELGTGAAHHNEYFDVDENALHVGAAETLALVCEYFSLDLE